MEIKIALTDAQVASIAEAIRATLAPDPADGPPLRVAQAADALGISASAVYRAVNSGRLPRIAGISRVLIPRSSITQTQKGNSSL